MPAQLFPLYDGSQRLAQQQQMERSAQLQQAQIARESAFQNAQLQLSQQSHQAEQALRQQQFQAEQQAAPLRQQLLQQEIGKNQTASAAALLSLQKARDLAPLEYNQAQQTLSNSQDEGDALRQRTVNDVIDTGLKIKQSDLSQKLGTQQLSTDAQKFSQEHAANLGTLALMRPDLRGIAVKSLLNSQSISPEEASSVSSVPYSPATLEDYARDVGSKLNDSDRFELLSAAKMMNTVSTPQEDMITRSLGKQSPHDQGLAIVSRITAAMAAARDAKNKGPVVSPEESSIPKLPLTPEGKPDAAILLDVKQTPDGKHFQTPQGIRIWNVKTRTLIKPPTDGVK